MTGLGSRFVAAGYKDPKPLIEIHGKTILSYVLDLFPGETNFTFICRKDVLEGQKEKLFSLIQERIAKPAQQISQWHYQIGETTIIAIDGHKLGPVYAVEQIAEYINDDEETIVNYCDFFMNWDYQDFKSKVKGYDGAIPCYTGFHPHLLPEKNLYASCKSDEKNNLIEIREKYSFEQDKKLSSHSAGTYYFGSGSIVKKYFKKLIEAKDSLNGEYYVSLVYNAMCKDTLKTLVYDDVKHFCQWGTPEDLEEYLYWAGIFENFDKSTIAEKLSIPNSNKLIPMAGAGSRFTAEGYQTPKPLIPVNGKAMVLRAADALPNCDHNIFIMRDFHIEDYDIDKELKKSFTNINSISIKELTEGQACTCLIAKDQINNEKELFIAASDNSMIYDANKLEAARKDADCLVFSFRNNVTVKSKPEQYGWLKTNDNGEITEVSVKKAISKNPMQDHAIVGAFWFKRGSDFVDAAESMIRKNRRINNEFYVDEAINDLLEAGLKAKVFEVDYYICWGRPDDLRSFEYWQDFFSECKILNQASQ